MKISKTGALSIAAISLIVFYYFRVKNNAAKDSPSLGGVGAPSNTSGGQGSGQDCTSPAALISLDQNKALGLGSTGCEVKYLQSGLNSEGKQNLVVDGQFGSQTKAALLAEVAEAKASIEAARLAANDPNLYFSDYAALQSIESGGQTSISQFNQLIKS